VYGIEVIVVVLCVDGLHFIVGVENNRSMNTSSAFSDYMVTYSVNRSINLSPTSGRLHRQKDRGSYGPTICLLNRSREKIEESTAPDSKEEALL
jgi:hypothetical protein